MVFINDVKFVPPLNILWKDFDPFLQLFHFLQNRKNVQRDPAVLLIVGGVHDLCTISLNSDWGRVPRGLAVIREWFPVMRMVNIDMILG